MIPIERNALNHIISFISDLSSGYYYQELGARCRSISIFAVKALFIKYLINP
jgi:hypothetical protein